MAATPAENLELQIAGRQVIGFQHLFGSMLKGDALNRQIEGVLRQLNALAREPAEQIAIVPVLAENQGIDVARQRLSSIETDSPALLEDIETLETIYSEGPDAIDPAQRSRMIDNYKWFGRLALAWQKGPDDPWRRSTLRAAMRTTLGGVAAVVAGGFALVVGIVLLIIAIVRIAGRKLLPAYVPESGTGAFVNAFALYLAVLIGVGLIARLLFNYGEMFNPGTIIAALAPLACLWPLRRGVPFAELRRGLGWYCGRGFFREVAAGMVGYLAGIPVIALGLLITFVLVRVAGTAPTHPIAREISADPWAIVALLGLASIYAPLAEETMFRGAFYHGLRGRLGFVLSALVVSFVFAAIHPQGWSAIPALMSIAIVLAALREWRGSLIAPITAHAINNGVLVTLLIVIAG